MKGGAAIVEALLRHGVTTFFGIPGAQTYELFDALALAGDRVSVLAPRHEQAAAYMAFGYAKASGRLGVFSVVPGPGILNAAAAGLTANTATAPLLGLTGEIPSSYIGRGRGHLHELPDQVGTLQSFLKWAHRIDHAADAPQAVEHALREALSGRQGVVVLAMPWDVMSEDADIVFPPTASDEELTQRRAPTAVSVDAAAAVVAEARSPMVMVGGGALDASAQILALAELLEAPVVSHRSGRGIVSEAHDLGMPGYPASKLWKETDVLIAIGTRLELPYMRWADMLRFTPRPRIPRLVRIDIDPEELTRLPADVDVLADASLGTAALVEALQAEGVRASGRRDAIRAAKAEAEAEYVERLQPQTGYLRAIRDVLPEDGIFVEELSQLGFASWFAYPVYAPRTYVSAGAQGTLGFGFPTALGAKVADPERAVVSVTGDGGLLFAVQELATAAEYGLGVVTIVVNNGGYANVRRDQQTRFDGRVFKADFRNPDFVALAEAFGVAGHRATTPDTLRSVLEGALGDGGPALIEIPVELGGEASPWPFIHPFGL
jgi:acetolactate synthase I/II/III large subunit